MEPRKIGTLRIKIAQCLYNRAISNLENKQFYRDFMKCGWGCFLVSNKDCLSNDYEPKLILIIKANEMHYFSTLFR